MGKKKELRLHPALLFLILTLVVMVVSSVGSILNIEASYYNVNSNTGNLVCGLVFIYNLLNIT